MSIASIDPIALAVVKGGLEQIVDEMDAIIVRAAFSPVISERKDRAAGLFHPQTGEVVAQGGQTLPVFMTAMHFSVEAVLAAAKARGGFRPGDVYIMNNPYLGGTHLPDIKLVMPVFHDGGILALLASCGHFKDIGGSTPGGFAPGATEVYQEGILINPVPLYAAGTLQADLLGLFIDNLRVPDERRGDLQALLSALQVGAERFLDLVGRYGAATISGSFEELNDRSERHMRSLIAEIPDGVYRFADTLDNDGHIDRPVVSAVAVTVHGETMRFDFTGSAALTRGPLNLPRKTSIAACQIGVKHIFPEVSINGGCFRPFEYVIPEGSVLAATHPHPTSGYTETVGRLISVVMGALGQALPQRTPADSFVTTGVITMSGRHPERANRYVMLLPAAGGYGGNPDGDGLVNGPTALGAANYPSVESVEHRVPVRVERLAIRERSGGAGRHRGGCGTAYTYRFLVDGIAVAILGDRCAAGPYGVQGGAAGASGDVVLRDADGHQSRLPMVSKGSRILGAGDVIDYLSPGGGYGDPLERDPEQVRRDAELGYIDTDDAHAIYGVVLHRREGEPWSVNLPATQSRRQEAAR
jgi:N-methylhydantoinase B